MNEGIDLHGVVQGLIECMCWAEAGDPQSSLGDTAPDLHPSANLAAIEICGAFVKRCTDMGIDLEDLPTNEEHIGHDIWLTLRHHGAGFWDRGYGEVGQRLTKIAHEFEGYDCYIGDDGLVYLQ